MLTSQANHTEAETCVLSLIQLYILYLNEISVSFTTLSYDEFYRMSCTDMNGHSISTTGHLISCKPISAAYLSTLCEIFDSFPNVI